MTFAPRPPPAPPPSIPVVDVRMPATARRPMPARRRRPRIGGNGRGGPPSAALIFLPPLVLCLGTVGIAAVHGALGFPLGVTFAAEIWTLAKTAITACLAVAGFGGYVHRNNTKAWALHETLEDEADDAAARMTLPPSSPMIGAGSVDTPTRRRGVGAHPPTSPEVAARRTGKLTPISADVSDSAARVRDRVRPPPPQAGNGGTR